MAPVSGPKAEFRISFCRELQRDVRKNGSCGLFSGGICGNCVDGEWPVARIAGKGNIEASRIAPKRRVADTLSAGNVSKRRRQRARKIPHLQLVNGRIVGDAW